MGMPPDPGTGTTPLTDAAGDPTGSIDSQSQSELYQDALNSAAKAEESAQHGLQGLYDQLSQLGSDPGDTDSVTGGPGPKSQQWIKQTQDLDRQIQAASNQLAAAKRNTATVYTKIASDSSARARTQAQSQTWAVQAQSAAAAAQYKNDQANLLEAYGAQKDLATIQNLQAAAAKSGQQLQLIAQQTQTSASQQALNSARAVQISETTPAIIQMDQARTQVYGSQVTANNARAQYLTSRVGVSQSQTDLNDARAQLISGPQAQSLLSTSELRQAQANKLDLTNGATLADLQAKAGLSDARIRQIAANIGRSQILPYTDRTSPNLTVFQPSTGTVTGVPNPGYVNTTMQGINDTNSAIQQVQNEIAQGTMTPDEGTALIDNLRQSLQYKALGVTPDQYIQAQQQQAAFGQGIVNGAANLGNSMSTQFMDLARNARTDVGPITPYENAIGMMGGPSAMQQAFSLIRQVRPITDRFSALDAAQKYAAAANILKSNPSGSTVQQPATTPAAQPGVSGGATPYQGAPNPNVFGSGTGTVPTNQGMPMNPNDPALLQQIGASGLGVAP